MIYRGKVKNIIFEFSPSEGKNKKGIVIICDGLPSVPKQKKIISFLSKKGFFVIFPRYQGTWESGGEFLKDSPKKDILEIINLVKKGKIIELYYNQSFNTFNQKIFLLGSSFGGSVVLSLLDNKNVNKFIAISPIVNFKTHNKEKNEQDLLWLGKFIKKAFGESYRFKDVNWKKMIEGNIFNPPANIPLQQRKKCLIIYDELDSQVSSGKIKEYVSKNEIESIITENLGHISFSKLSDDLLEKITEYFV